MDADASGLMHVSKALVQDKGSSTNKQDVVASGGQSVFKNRSIARAIGTSFLSVYASVIPEEQHTAVWKETGETAHVERWNNTLRQRLARFVRMTLSFSKSVLMHEACLLLFLYRYNADRALLLK